MKRVLAILMCVTLLFIISTPVLAFEDASTYVKKSIVVNEELTPKPINPTCTTQEFTDLARFDSVNIAVSNDKTTLFLEAVEADDSYYITLKGNAELVQTGKTEGYVGVYDGYITYLGHNIPVIVDVIFTSKNVFAVLTIGVASETSVPNISFYGTLSSDLSLISNTYSAKNRENCLEADKFVYDVSELADAKSVDGTTRYQGTVDMMAGGYYVGHISVFHANELRNQGTTVTHVKVNSKTASTLSYIRNVLGYNVTNNNAYDVKPQRFTISLNSNNPNMYLTTNGFSPQNNITTVTVKLPYITISTSDVVSLKTTDFTIKTSETTATLSTPYSNTLNNHKITWNLTKTFGFASSEYDGNETTQTGMVVSADFTHGSDSTENITTSISTTASIRYVYYVDTAGTDLTLHFTTSSKTITTPITLVP